MPNINYQYNTLVAIGFAPLPVPPILCQPAQQGALIGLAPQIAATWPQLHNAAMTTAALAGPGYLNNRETLWRINGFRTASRMLGGGNLRVTPNYLACDPTEKAQLSYLLGSTLCCLVAERTAVALGGVGNNPANLMHYSRFILQLIAPVMIVGGGRPDYISQIGGTFQVWEAKGIANGGNAVLRRALNQAQNVLIIGPGQPASYIAVLTHLDPNNNWRIRVADPPGQQDEKPHDASEQGKLYRAYYEPWVEMIKTSNPTEEKKGNKIFVTFELIHNDMFVGLDQEIYSIFMKSEDDPLQLYEKIAGILKNNYKLQDDEETYVNTNGLYCRLTKQSLAQLDIADKESAK